jgi:O-antigen ligase
MSNIKNKSVSKFFIFLLLFYSNIAFKFIIDFATYVDMSIIITFFLFYISILSLFTLDNRYTYFILSLLILFIYLFINSIFSINYVYALNKLYLGLLLPILIFSVFVKFHWSEFEVTNYMLYSVILLDIITIILKLRTGFFDRSSGFGFLGPITFGWINGMVFILFLFSNIFSKKIKIFILFFFALMILWCSSKGPFIAAFIFIIYRIRFYLFQFRYILIILFFSVIIISILFLFSDKIRAVNGLINIFNNVNNSQIDNQTDINSFTIRVEYLQKSFRLFSKNVFIGVGFGDWNEYFHTFHKYPHNFVFEILSEVGLIGLIFFLLIISTIITNNNFTLIGIYILMCMLFSGDFSYFRYSLLPFLFGFYFNKIYKKLKQ